MKNLKRMHKNNRGVTLIEVLVATMMLALLTIPLLSAIVTSARIEAKSRTTQETTSLVQDIMEEVKAEPLTATFSNLQDLKNGTISSYQLGGVALSGNNFKYFLEEKSADGKFVDLYEAYIEDATDSYDVRIVARRDTSVYGDGNAAFGEYGLPQSFKYKITVELYRPGTATPVSSMTGTKLDNLMIKY